MQIVSTGPKGDTPIAAETFLTVTLDGQQWRLRVFPYNVQVMWEDEYGLIHSMTIPAAEVFYRLWNGGLFFILAE